MKGYVIPVLLSVVGTSITVQCCSTGAPWYTCLTMFPVHSGTQRQSEVCPFQVIASETNYSPSDRLNLTINSKSPGRTFKGFQIRARPRYGDTEQIVGQFVDLPTNGAQTMDCLGDRQNVVTNKNSNPLEEIQLTWLAPSNLYADIEFVTSFVEDFHTFWTDVTVPVTANEIVDVQPPEIVSPNFADIDWSACGASKGCYLYPRYCTGDYCYAAVTYKLANDTVQFEMFGPRMGYISVGFSDDMELGNDETITCTAGNNNTTIQRGHNDENMNNDRQFQNGIKEMEATYKDDRLYCRFKRPMSMDVYIGEGHTFRKVYDLSEKHYIILMWGDIYDGTDVIRRYKELPPITDTMVDLHVSEIVRGSSLPLSIKMHGTLMLLAWIMLITISVLIARHFKGAFNEGVCGNIGWLKLHMGLSVVSWLLTVAGFVLIFIVVGRMTERAKIHSYMGITVMSASTLQIVLGVFRPGEDSPSRIVYNWGHWFIGKCTHILAGVTFLFAFNTDITPLPQKHFAYIVLGVYTAILVILDVSFDVAKRVRLRKASEKYELKDMKRKTSEGLGENKSVHEASSFLGFIVYTVCVIGVTTSAITCIHLF